ncbi:MAG: hypothetical protein Q8Q49_03105 [bacterium]|nr:hypothetical protein [bacterium]
MRPNEINNLYRANTSKKSETFDEVIVQTGIVPKKFFHIALFEWLLLVKPKGKLIMVYVPDSNTSSDELEKSLWWIGRGKYEILDHVVGKLHSKIILKKTHAMIANLGKMDEWTFGIVTNGERDDWIDQIIRSIRALKIPKYEIIICGKYRKREEKNIKIIDFIERADKGWITRKKNLIADKAAYENMCIIHDRLVFDRNWYRGMRKYGNSFELLGCIQIEKNTRENAGDWLTLGGPMGTRWKISRLTYSDWDFYGYLSGQLMIIKKSIWEKTLWDETRYWDGVDDADWDIIFRARDLGHIIRFNPFSSVTALTWRHGKLPLKYDVSEGIFPKDMVMRRLLRTGARIMNAFPLVSDIAAAFASKFIKTRIYKHFLYH